MRRVQPRVVETDYLPVDEEQLRATKQLVEGRRFSIGYVPRDQLVRDRVSRIEGAPRNVHSHTGQPLEERRIFRETGQAHHALPGW